MCQLYTMACRMPDGQRTCICHDYYNTACSYHSLRLPYSIHQSSSKSLFIVITVTCNLGWVRACWPSKVATCSWARSASCRCTSNCCSLSGSCSGSSWGALPELVASPSARARVLHCFPANPSHLVVAHQLQCPSTAGPGSRHEGCGVSLLLMWAVDFGVAHEKCWRRPSGRTAYVAPRWVLLKLYNEVGLIHRS